MFHKGLNKDFIGIPFDFIRISIGPPMIFKRFPKDSTRVPFDFIRVSINFLRIDSKAPLNIERCLPMPFKIKEIIPNSL